MDGEDFMLTTRDNPWNPYTHWDEWYAWDQSHGYDTPGLLARNSTFSFDLSDGDQQLAIEEAINSIVNDPSNFIYKKIFRNDVIVGV